MRILIGHERPLTRLTVLAASITLFAAMMFIVVSPGRAALATVTIESAVVQPGGSVSVSVDAFLSPDLLAATTIEIDYDPGVVDAVGCTTVAGSCNINNDHDGINPDTVFLNIRVFTEYVRRIYDLIELLDATGADW